MNTVNTRLFSPVEDVQRFAGDLMADAQDAGVGGTAVHAARLLRKEAIQMDSVP